MMHGAQRVSTLWALLSGVMILSRFSIILVVGLPALGCADSGDAEPRDDGPPEQPAFSVETVDFELDDETLLSSLSDEEINGACEHMASILLEADRQIACQVVAVAEESTEACESARDTCMDDPDDALQQTSLRSTPAPVRCELFDSNLTTGCEKPLSMLEACANALAQSVVPSGTAVHCDLAEDFDDVVSSQQAATTARANFVTACAELTQCEDLVAALLDQENGAEGAGGASE